jgi:hypothetical protein
MTTANATPTKPSSKKAYPLRVDPDIFEQVKERAKQDGRSVNRQIEFLLRQALTVTSTNK